MRDADSRTLWERLQDGETPIATIRQTVMLRVLGVEPDEACPAGDLYTVLFEPEDRKINLVTVAATWSCKAQGFPPPEPPFSLEWDVHSLDGENWYFTSLCALTYGSNLVDA